MSVKKPLVVTNGQIEQLQSGDTIEHPGILNRTNNNAGSIVIGQAVFVDGAGSVDLAQADAASTTDVLGLVTDTSIAAAASGGIITSGVLTATTGEWDIVTGQVGGLTAGSKYWLDESTAGSLTTTAPTTAGEFVAPVGKALSTTEFEVDVDHTIKL
jgi:hypothetical protein